MNSERKVSEKRMAHAEIIENSIGTLHRWQVMVFLLVFLVNFPLALQELSITLIAPPVSFNCSDPNYSQCDKDCPSHIFSTKTFSRTIQMDWDLVCDRKWLDTFSQTILMAGILVGNFFFGVFADRYGRRKPLIAGVILEIITGIALAFSTYFWVFLVLRFLVAVAAGGTLCTAFCIVVEIIGRKYRSTFGILFQMTYYLGQATLGLVGYLIRDWVHIQLTISLPVVLLISYWWLLPESPRWLLSVGKLEEAVQVLERGARFNRMPTEHIRDIVMNRLQDKEATNENFLDLFKTPNIRIKTFCICLNWIVLGLCFFGVAQHMGRIAGNIFINISSSGLIQIPGNIIIIYSLEKLGRKISIIATYTVSGVCCIILAVLPDDPEWASTLMGSLGMMGISASFAIIYVWSGELYATPVRNVGMGTSAMCAKFGSMVAPFLSYMDKYGNWLPPLIFGITPFIAIAASLKLPETLNTKMPDSIEEAEQFGRKSITDNS